MLSCVFRPAGRAPEPLPLWRLRALHPSTLPHPLDQRERLLELRALLLQVPGPGHQHQEPSAGSMKGICATHTHTHTCVDTHEQQQLLSYTFWQKEKPLAHTWVITVAPFDLKSYCSTDAVPIQMNLSHAAHGIQLTNRPAQRGAVQFDTAQKSSSQAFRKTSHKQDADSTWTYSKLQDLWYNIQQAWLSSLD